ncbi:hypothetical protein XELAEV_18008577mg [Xenopus laevis]|uniref:Uncharacterized protein n=1 Tax=Xenopus laevis TaxID=8355 RepID=A0A974E491_XENLA|nr:hypothetical protein XELAEV_18008577mg [Xenopus laevis]
MFLDSSASYISSSWIKLVNGSERLSLCLEMSLRSRLSRASSCSLMFLNRAVTLRASLAALSATSLLDSSNLWVPLSVSSLSGLRFSRMFLSLSISFSKASLSSSTLWPLCSPLRPHAPQIGTAQQ